MHTLTIRVPTNERDYDSFCEFLTDECHIHGKNLEKENPDALPCPINAFCCPFNYESCLSVEPDDWFKIVVIDSKPWN